MRILYVFFFLGVLSCSAASKPVEIEQDSRFDLARFVIPNLLIEDIKTCVKRSTQIPPDPKQSQLFNTVTGYTNQFWMQLDSRMDFDAVGKGAVLYYGDVVDSMSDAPSSIFDNISRDEVKGIRSPKDYKCGEVAGRAVMSLGFLSFPDSMKVAQEMDPAFLSEKGITQEKLEAVTNQMQRRIDVLSSISDAKVVDCVALTQIDRMIDRNKKPYSDIWTYLLQSKISDQAILRENIPETGTYWHMFSEKGAMHVSKLSDVEEVRLDCLQTAHNAVLEVAGQSQ